MLIESIPNVSEGRRPDIVAGMAAAIRAVEGVRLLDHSSDASHNRSVFTLVGDAAGVERAVLALFERAVADVDLRTHRGEHPRLGFPLRVSIGRGAVLHGLGGVGSTGETERVDVPQSYLNVSRALFLNGSEMFRSRIIIAVRHRADAEMIIDHPIGPTFPHSPVDDALLLFRAAEQPHRQGAQLSPSQHLVECVHVLQGRLRSEQSIGDDIGLNREPVVDRALDGEPLQAPLA